MGRKRTLPKVCYRPEAVFQKLVSSPNEMEKIRQLVVVVCYTAACSIFWGCVAAAAVRYGFDIDPGSALVAVGLPTALAFSVFIFPRISRIVAMQ